MSFEIAFYFKVIITEIPEVIRVENWLIDTFNKNVSKQIEHNICNIQANLINLVFQISYKINTRWQLFSTKKSTAFGRTEKSN